MEIINGARFYSSEKASERYLEVNSCGYTLAENVDMPIRRLSGRKDYQLMYIAGGLVRLEDGGDPVELGPGYVIVYRPGETQVYNHIAECRTQVYWLHFSGTAADELLTQAGFDGRYVFVGQVDEVAEHIASIMSELHMKRCGWGIGCIAHMLALVSALSQAGHSDLGTEEAGAKGRFGGVMMRMNLHCEDDHPVDELARSCGLSKFHFIRLFKQATGLTPHAYLASVRLKKAEYLLKNTDMNISEIAATVGYQNQLYFSRLFAKYMGMPPSDYRKMD